MKKLAFLMFLVLAFQPVFLHAGEVAKAKDAVVDAADETGDTLEEWGDEAGDLAADTAEDAGEEVKDAAEDVKAKL